MPFSWPIMLGALGALVVVSALVVFGVRLLARHERYEEDASQITVDIARALAREPRLRGAAILPVATIPLEGRPSIELTGRVPSTRERDLAIQLVDRELDRLRPGMQIVDHLAIAPADEQRRPA